MNEGLVKLGLVVGAGIIGTLVAGPAGGAAAAAAVGASCAPAENFEGGWQERSQTTKENVERFKDAYNNTHSD